MIVLVFVVPELQSSKKAMKSSSKLFKASMNCDDIERRLPVTVLVSVDEVEVFVKVVVSVVVTPGHTHKRS